METSTQLRITNSMSMFKYLYVNIIIILLIIITVLFSSLVVSNYNLKRLKNTINEQTNTIEQLKQMNNSHYIKYSSINLN